MPEFLSVAEAAALLHVSPDHVRRHAPLIRLGRRTLVRGSWVASLGQPTPTAPAETPTRPKPVAGRTFEFPKATTS